MKKLVLRISKTNVAAQKTHSSRQENYVMIIASFQVDDKGGKSCLFEKTLFMADISMDIAFKMFFLTLSNVEINFNSQELRCRL